MNEITNTPEVNNENTLEDLSPARRRHIQAQYQRLLNLIPTGKHKKQRGQKGAFGKSKFLNRK